MIQRQLQNIFILALLIVTISITTLSSASASTPFADVPESSAYFRPIEYFNILGIVQGYPDIASGKTYFKPDKNVNRAEAVKLLLSSANKNYIIEKNLTADVFPDVKVNDWFAPYVKVAKNANIVKGNDTTKLFDPGRNVNAAELLKMAVQANGIDLEPVLQEVTTDVSKDVVKSAWFYPYFVYGREFGIVFPDVMGNFNPSKELTRGEVVQIMYNFAKITKGGQIQELLSRTEAKILSAITKINLQDYDGAIADMDKAKGFSNRALLLSPSETVVQEAFKMTNAFSFTVAGFKYWKKDNNINQAIEMANKAEQEVLTITQLTELKKSVDVLITTLKKAQ